MRWGAVGLRGCTILWGCSTVPLLTTLILPQIYPFSHSVMRPTSHSPSIHLSSYSCSHSPTQPSLHPSTQSSFLLSDCMSIIFPSSLPPILSIIHPLSCPPSHPSMLPYSKPSIYHPPITHPSCNPHVHLSIILSSVHAFMLYFAGGTELGMGTGKSVQAVKNWKTFSKA